MKRHTSMKPSKDEKLTTNQVIAVNPVVKVKVNAFDFKLSKNNKLSTTKYKWWNFIPIFLFEQYKRVFNIFEIVIAVVNLLPFAGVTSPATIFMPIIMILGVAAIREIIEDTGRMKSDTFQNNQIYQIVRNKTLIPIKAQDICQGDIIVITENQELPCDVLLLSSSEESNMAFVNTASLDGESNLKPKCQVIPYRIPGDISMIIKKFYGVFGQLVTTPPSNNMADFNGKISIKSNKNSSIKQIITKSDERSDDDSIYTVDEENLQVKLKFNIDNITLKGVTLKNTVFMIGIAIFTAMDTRLMMSQGQRKTKTSRIEKRLNMMLLVLIGIVITLDALNVLLAAFAVDYKEVRKEIWFEKEASNLKALLASRALQFMIICSYFLPISLMVGLELSRFFQAILIEADKRMCRDDVRSFIAENGPDCLQHSQFGLLAPSQLSVQVKSAISVENLAEVDIVFSDKTGTLTKNEMTFSQLVSQTNDIRSEPRTTELFTMVLCHNLLPRTNDGKIEYQGESPDEIAFALKGAECGLTLVQRHASKVFYDYDVKINGVMQRRKLIYNVIATIPFSSQRKRMSIILQEQGTELAEGVYFGTPEEIVRPGGYFIITKGADNVMLPMFKRIPFMAELQVNVDKLSEKGLRTLAFGYRTIEFDAVTQWLHQWDSVKQLKDDTKQYNDVTEIIEKDIQYVLISAIEDKLQDQVQDVLSSLRNTGIKIWMLTGDKTLTAVSIAKSTGLSTKEFKELGFTQQAIQDKKRQSPESTNEQIIQMILNDAIYQQTKSLTEECKLEYQTQLRDKHRITQKFLAQTQPRSTIFKRNKPSLLNLPFTVVIDAEFFRALLSCQMHYQFFQVAFSSQAVVCCRLSPKEKSVIVSYCHHYHPEMTTLAVGDGANDTAMIKTAQVGVGIAGKEGLHACNNSDISIPELKFLKRLIFVHGRLNHMRNSELIEYSIYKNSILVFCNMFYQIYQHFSGQIITESFMLMMFNTVITFFCIFIFTVNEKDVYETSLQQFPQQLKFFRRRWDSNFQSIIKNVIYALYGASVIFFTLKYYFQDGLISHYQADFYFFQAVLMMIVVFVAIVKVMLTTRIFNWVTVLGVVLSVAVSYGTQFVGNFFTGFGIGEVGALEIIYSGIGPSLMIFMLAFLCLLPPTLEYFIVGFLNPDIGFELMNQERARGVCVEDVEF